MKRRYTVVALLALGLVAVNLSTVGGTVGSREECLQRCERRAADCFDFCSGELVERCETFCSQQTDPADCRLACDAVERACNQTCEVKLLICRNFCERLFPVSPSAPA